MCRCELGDERAIAEALSVKDQAIRIEDDKGEMPLHKLARQGCVPSLNPNPDPDPDPDLCTRLPVGGASLTLTPTLALTPTLISAHARPWGVRAAACCSPLSSLTKLTNLPTF